VALSAGNLNDLHAVEAAALHPSRAKRSGFFGLDNSKLTSVVGAAAEHGSGTGDDVGVAATCGNIHHRAHDRWWNESELRTFAAVLQAELSGVIAAASVKSAFVTASNLND
jgi:hypothetical protein